MKPSSRAEKVAIQSISSISNLPINTYFVDSDSRFIDVNTGSAEILGAQSIRNILGKPPDYFTHKELGSLVLANNNAVIQSASLKIFEEAGARNDDFPVNALSFKFPWYFDNKIIGLFGCSIKIDTNSLSDIGNKLALITSTGLLGPVKTASTKYLPNSQFGDMYFTKREQTVISHLVRGRTAKEIGELLFISKRTVETHIDHIKSKANCTSKSELIDKLVDQFI